METFEILWKLFGTLLKLLGDARNLLKYLKGPRMSVTLL